MHTWYTGSVDTSSRSIQHTRQMRLGLIRFTTVTRQHRAQRVTLQTVAYDVSFNACRTALVKRAAGSTRPSGRWGCIARAGPSGPGTCPQLLLCSIAYISFTWRTQVSCTSCGFDAHGMFATQQHHHPCARCPNSTSLRHCISVT
jgi:hypothetical protein